MEEPLTDSNESEELPRVGMCSHNVATNGLPPQSPRSQGGGRQGWKALGNPVFNKPTTAQNALMSGALLHKMLFFDSTHIQTIIIKVEILSGVSYTFYFAREFHHLISLV